MSGQSPDSIQIDDDNIHVGYRRELIFSNINFYENDQDLPQDIKWKLFLVRQLALFKYREVHNKT